MTPEPTIADRVDQVIDALDCGCTRDEVRASAEALRGAVEAAGAP